MLGGTRRRCRFVNMNGQDRRGFQSLCTYVAALMFASPACALSPDLRIKQFYHTAWTAKEAAPTDIEDLAQTRDGYLWIASTAGLFRFDGVRFERIDDVGSQVMGEIEEYDYGKFGWIDSVAVTIPTCRWTSFA